MLTEQELHDCHIAALKSLAESLKQAEMSFCPPELRKRIYETNRINREEMANGNKPLMAYYSQLPWSISLVYMPHPDGNRWELIFAYQNITTGVFEQSELHGDYAALLKKFENVVRKFEKLAKEKATYFGIILAMMKG